MNKKTMKRAVLKILWPLLYQTKSHLISRLGYSGIGSILMLHRVCPTYGVYSFGLAGDGYTFSFNGEDNDMELGVSGVYLSHSDSKNIGVGYGAGVGIFDGGVHYHWMSNGDHVVGGATTLTVGGVGLETSADWNLSASDVNGKVGTSLDLWGAEASAVSSWDIDDLSYDGLELGVGYAIPVDTGIHITPSVGMDFDSDWGRSDANASVAINLSFGSNGIQAL